MADEVRFYIHPAARESINAAALKVVERVREHQKPEPVSEAFRTQRHMSLALTDADVLGEMQVWHCDMFGRPLAVSFSNGPLTHTIDEDAYQGVLKLILNVMKLQWARQSLGALFVEKSIIDGAESA
jgi:hypothetical protein